MLGNIISGFIVILVGVTLAPTVANEVQGARYNQTGDATPNMSSSSSTILGLTVLFYNLSIASTAIGIAAQGLRNSGLM
jgi:xanthine/uracil permease